MRTYSLCCTTVTKGQIEQILLLHVTKAGPDWAFTRPDWPTRKIQNLCRFRYGFSTEDIKLQLLKESATNITLSNDKIKLKTVFDRLRHMSLSGVLTGFIWRWSTAFSQIVKRVHGTKKVGNHCSNCLFTVRSTLAQHVFYFSRNHCLCFVIITALPTFTHFHL